MLDSLDALKEKMVLVCKALQKQRLLDGYGHLTARLADGRILSTPHMPPGKVAVRDLIILDHAGNKVEGAGEPNGETPMHTSIYKARPDVQCILHYHPDELIVVAARRSINGTPSPAPGCREGYSNPTPASETQTTRSPSTSAASTSTSPPPSG